MTSSGGPEGTRRLVERRLADARGRRVVFVLHCLLNENVRYLGGATRPGVVAEVVDRYAHAGVGLYQMPCPEQRAWGGVLKRRMIRLYGARLLRRRAVRRPVLAVGCLWTRAVYGRMAHRVADDVVDYLRSGCDVVEIVGVGASPSCGVTTTLDLDGAAATMAGCDPGRLDCPTVNREVVAAHLTPGRGLFMAAVERALRRRGASVRLVEHDLIAELHDAGALQPTNHVGS